MRVDLAAAGFGMLLLTAPIGPAAAGAMSCELNWGSDLRGNTCFGSGTLPSNTLGSFNSAFGASALTSNTTGMANTAAGDAALLLNVSGHQNTAVGAQALRGNEAGRNNTAMGNRAGGKQTGNNNTSIGMEAGWRGGDGDGVAITGNDNIALGYQAGAQWSTGSNNIAIGAPGAFSDAATIRIGDTTKQTRAFIAGIFGAKVAKRGSSAVLIDSSGQLGTIKSSIRYKEDVHDMGEASSLLLQLRPVTFRYKEADADGTKPIQYGLVAEEVEQVMPDLVVRNADGSVETVAYHFLPSLILSEYQKQNRDLVETKARLAAMEQELAAMKLALARLAASGVSGRSRVSFAP